MNAKIRRIPPGVLHFSVVYFAFSDLFHPYFSRTAMSQPRILKPCQLLWEESGRWTSIWGKGKLSPC